MTPCRLPDPGGRWTALHHQAAARACETQALRAAAPHTLMQAAGLAVAKVAQAVSPHGRRAWTVVGPGNNGGDGLVAALALHRAGWQVELSLLPSGGAVPDDARWALDQARAAGLRLQQGPRAPSTAPDLVIDALLGRGQSRAPDHAMATALGEIRHWTELGTPALAVDLPTGLCGDSGRLLTPLAVQARATVALLTCAPGLFTAHGRDLAGQLWFAPLTSAGPAADSATARLAGPADWQQAVSTRRHAQHKGSFGDVWVIGGAPGMAGAAHLAARAALVAGAGRVLRCGLDGAPSSADPVWPELMQREPAAWRATGVLENATVVCGCGGGAAVRTELPAILSRSARLVLDADALNAVAQDPGLAHLLQQRAAHQRLTVLTPHPLEAARLLGCTTAQVQDDRLGQAQALAAMMQCVVLLKGSGSIVAAPHQIPVVNPSGNARLATAGSGDVLAGWLGGLWAQAQAAATPTAEVPGYTSATLATLVSAAAWSHGMAAERSDPGEQAQGPLTASGLIQALQAFRHTGG